MKTKKTKKAATKTKAHQKRQAKTIKAIAGEVTGLAAGLLKSADRLDMSPRDLVWVCGIVLSVVSRNCVLPIDAVLAEARTMSAGSQI